MRVFPGLSLRPEFAVLEEAARFRSHEVNGQ